MPARWCFMFNSLEELKKKKAWKPFFKIIYHIVANAVLYTGCFNTTRTRCRSNKGVSQTKFPELLLNNATGLASTGVHKRQSCPQLKKKSNTLCSLTPGFRTGETGHATLNCKNKDNCIAPSRQHVPATGLQEHCFFGGEGVFMVFFFSVHILIDPRSTVSATGFNKRRNSKGFKVVCNERAVKGRGAFCLCICNVYHTLTHTKD